MRQLFVALVVLSIPLVTQAGGDSYETTIESFERISERHYKVAVITLSDPRERMVIHLRYRPMALGLRPPTTISRASYEDCISRIREHFRKRETFRLGFMGTGVVPVEGRAGEFESNALALEEEANGNKVCYSYARPT